MVSKESIKRAVQSLEQFHNDKSAVAYLIFYILASMFIFGITYALISDLRDSTMIQIYNSMSPMGLEYNDDTSLWGFDFINLLLSFSVTFFVIALIWFSIQMAQKPESPWG